MIEIPIESELKCYHCGDNCRNHDTRHYLPYTDETLFFCCQGCLTVYSILNQNDLCAYYDFEKNPGQKMNSSSSKFNHLKAEAIADRLLTFKSETLNVVKLNVPGIHCTSCIWLLENLAKLNEGIIKTEVNFHKRQVTVSYNPLHIQLDKLVQLMASIGYEPYISLVDAGKNEVVTNRSLVYKIAVAGFCFGNIMLFSFPEYLGLNLKNDQSFVQLFYMLNLVLSIPVVFYSASDYFKSALAALKLKHLNLDFPIVLGLIALWTRSVFDIISQSGQGFLDSLSGLVFFLLIGKWYQQKTYKTLSFERDYESYFPVAVTKLMGNIEQSVFIKDLSIGDEILVRHNEIIPADAILISETAMVDYSFVTGEEEPIKLNNKDFVYAGGKVIGAQAHVLVQKKVEQSYLTQLWNHQNLKSSKHNALGVLSDVVSKWFTIGLLFITAITAVYWFYTDASKLLIVVTSVLLVACPCALALSLPYGMGTAMSVMARHGLYLKNSGFVEVLSTIKLLVFDKTGTLTQAHKNTATYIGQELSQLQEEAVKSLVALSTHPVSNAIFQFYQHILPTANLSAYQETPGIGISGDYKSIHVSLFKSRQKEKPGTLLIVDGNEKGYFVTQSVFRNGLRQMVTALKEKYKIHVLSGDNDKQRSHLQALFGNNTLLMFDQLPHQKRSYIDCEQQNGTAVLMLGDGLNDAVALQQADVGIAIAEKLNHFTPASDGILNANNLPLIPQYLQFAVATMRIIKYSFILSIGYNFFGVVLAVTGNLSPIKSALLMPLSSVTVVAFVTLATRFKGKKIFKTN